MKRKLLIFSVIVITIASCRPRDILSDRKMEDILFELHKADGVVELKEILYVRDTTLDYYYMSVLQKYGVSQAQFDSSLVWYTDNPQIFNKIYPRVIQRLEAERDALEIKKKDEIIEKKPIKSYEQK